MISNIQATRGLAALAVVFYHTGYLINYVHTEFYGVATFFVISGFLMPYITRESADNFMVDRLVRIVPLYWFFTIMFYVGVGGSRPFEMLAKSLLFIPGNDVRGDPHPLLNVGWTLNIEMFFYVLFALALVINRRSAPIIVAVLLLGAKFVLGGCQQRPECQLYAHHYTNYLILGIGAFYLWQLLHKSLPRVRSIIVFIAPLFFIAYIAFCISPTFTGLVGEPFGSTLPVDLFPTLLVLTLLLMHSAGLQCRWRPLLVLGDASYALYLSHFFVIKSLELAGLDLSHNVGAMLTTLTLAIMVAILVFYLIERPVLSALRKQVPRHLMYNIRSRVGWSGRAPSPLGTDAGTAALRADLDRAVGAPSATPRS